MGGQMWQWWKVMGCKISESQVPGWQVAQLWISRIIPYPLCSVTCRAFTEMLTLLFDILFIFFFIERN